MLSQSDFELCRLWRACIETRLAERITGIELGWLVDSSQLILSPYSITTLTRAWDGQGVGSWKVLLYSWFLSAAHQQTNPQPMLIRRVIWQFKISSRFSETFADKQSSVSLSSCLDVFMQSWTGPQSPWIDVVGHWWAGPRGISLQTAAKIVCLSAPNFLCLSPRHAGKHLDFVVEFLIVRCLNSEQAKYGFVFHPVPRVSICRRTRQLLTLRVHSGRLSFTFFYVLPAIVNNNPACSSQTKTGGVY